MKKPTDDLVHCESCDTYHVPNCPGDCGDDSLREVVAPPPAIQPLLGVGRPVAPDKELNELRERIKIQGELASNVAGDPLKVDDVEAFNAGIAAACSWFVELLDQEIAQLRRSERTEPKSAGVSPTNSKPSADLNPQTEASGRRNDH